MFIRRSSYCKFPLDGEIDVNICVCVDWDNNLFRELNRSFEVIKIFLFELFLFDKLTSLNRSLSFLLNHVRYFKHMDIFWPSYDFYSFL